MRFHLPIFFFVLIILFWSGCASPSVAPRSDSPTIPLADDSSGNGLSVFEKAISNFEKSEYTVTYSVTDKTGTNEATETKAEVVSLNDTDQFELSRYRYSSYPASLKFAQKGTAKQNVGKMTFVVEKTVTEKNVLGRTCDEVVVQITINTLMNNSLKGPAIMCLDRELGIPLKFDLDYGVEKLSFTALSVLKKENGENSPPLTQANVTCDSKIGNFVISQSNVTSTQTTFVLINTSGQTVTFTKGIISGKEGGSTPYSVENAPLNGITQFSPNQIDAITIVHPTSLSAGSFGLTYTLTFNAGTLTDLVATTTCQGII